MFLGKKREIEQRDRIIQYKRVFGSTEGKAVLFDLMNKYHVLNSHGGDALKEGQRSVVLGILSQCSINLDEFDKMMKGENAE